MTNPLRTLTKCLLSGVAIFAAFAAFAPAIAARELRIDQRGGAEFKTLAAAAAAARPGDTLVIAKGSGPYRETLRIRQSGEPDAPIVVEGNGETVTGFTTLLGFREQDGAVFCHLPQPFPLVLTFQGRRILQDQATGRLLGPVTLSADEIGRAHV